MSNVVNMFDKSTKKKEKSKDSEELDQFELAAKRNAETKERLKRERLNANKYVLRSYRIK